MEGVFCLNPWLSVLIFGGTINHNFPKFSFQLHVCMLYCMMHFTIQNSKLYLVYLIPTSHCVYFNEKKQVKGSARSKFVLLNLYHVYMIIKQNFIILVKIVIHCKIIYYYNSF